MILGELTVRGDLGALELVLEQLVALLGVIDQRLQRLLCPGQGLGFRVNFGFWGSGIWGSGSLLPGACTRATRHCWHWQRGMPPPTRPTTYQMCVCVCVDVRYLKHLILSDT